MWRSPLAAQFQIERRVAGDLVEHVVEKADAGRNMRVSGAVEVDGDRNPRLGCVALDFAAAHGILMAFETEAAPRPQVEAGSL